MGGLGCDLSEKLLKNPRKGRIGKRPHLRALSPARPLTHSLSNFGISRLLLTACDFPHRNARERALLSCSPNDVGSNGHDFFPAEPESARNNIRDRRTCL